MTNIEYNDKELTKDKVETDQAFLVFAGANYSSSNLSEGTAEEGTSKVLVGVAKDFKTAVNLVIEDHAGTVFSEHENPLDYPLMRVENVEFGPTWVLMLRGEQDGTDWVNRITWYITSVPFNVLLEDFEL
jgi:hypothetical protein